MLPQLSTESLFIIFLIIGSILCILSFLFLLYISISEPDPNNIPYSKRSYIPKDYSSVRERMVEDVLLSTREVLKIGRFVIICQEWEVDYFTTEQSGSSYVGYWWVIKKRLVKRYKFSIV